MTYDTTDSDSDGIIDSDVNNGSVVTNSVMTDREIFTDAAADPDEVGEVLRNGGDVKVYTGGGVVNLSNASGSGGRTDEELEDHIAGFFVSGSNTTVNYDDANNTIAIDATGTFDSANVQNVSGEVYAREFAGADLAEKVQTAQTWLVNNQGGEGKIRVTPKADGTDWYWGSDVTFDFVGDDYGLDLVCDENVHIVCENSGWALTITASDATGVNVESRSRIEGGRWRAASGATGWLRLNDTFRTRVNPSEVENFGTGVQLRNPDRWTESTHLSGSYKGVDTGIDFVPNNEISATSDGTDSFHDTYIEALQVSASNICLRTSGVFEYIHVDNPTFQITASGGTCIFFDSRRNDGTVFTAPKFESPANPGDVAAIEYGADFDAFYGPLFVNPRIGYGVDVDVRGTAGSPIPSIRAYGNRVWLEGLANVGTPMSWNASNGQLHLGDGGAYLTVNGSGEIVAVDEAGNSTTLT